METKVTDDEIFDALARAERVMPQTRDFEAARAAYEGIAARYLPLLQGDDREQLLRRRVADGILISALALDESMDLCEALLKARLAEGFDGIYDRSLTVGAFCGHAARAGDPARAVAYLVPLIEEMEAETTRRDDAIASTLEWALALLNQARAALATNTPGE